MRYLTAGESHGPGLTTIIEGLPAGMPLLAEDVNKELKRRQGGHGRGHGCVSKKTKYKSQQGFVMVKH